MTTPTKEQLYKVGYKVFRNHRPYGKLGKYATKKWFMEVEKELWASAALEYITEWEKIKNTKRVRLEVGKTYIAKDGSEVKIIYKSPVRATGFLGIRATDGKTHPDDAIWYNPDGSHNEKYDRFTIISPK